MRMLPLHMSLLWRLTVAGAVMPAGAASNILQNGGFENPIATDWTQEMTNWFAWGSATRTNWQKKSGEYSLGILGNWSGLNNGGFEQKAPVAGDRAYRIGFYYFWDNGFAARQRNFSVHWYDAASNALLSRQFDLNLVGVQSLWHFSGYYPLKSPSRAARLEVKFDLAFTNSGGVLYIDDAVLEDQGSAVESELANGHWELPLEDSPAGNWLLDGNAHITNWQKHARSYALGFFGLWGGASNGYAVQRLSVTGRHVYATGLWHYRDADFTCAVRQVRIEWKNSDGSAIASNIIPLANPVDATWQYAGGYSVTSPAAAVEVNLRLFCDGVSSASGVYYVDDVTWHDTTRTYPAYFRRQGTNLLDRGGQPFLIRGLALSGWLAPEPYMLVIAAGTNGEADTTTRVRDRMAEVVRKREDLDFFWNTYRSNFLTGDDIRRFAAEGVNTIRLPLNYRDISPQNNEGAFLPETFGWVDRAIGWCRTNGIGVILDLHVCPGGQAPENSGDSECLYIYSNKETGVACLWQTNAVYTNRTARHPASNRKRTADIWRTIARHYRTNEHVIAYEVMNEPHLPALSWSNVLRETLIQITDAIRDVDTNHLLFVEGDSFAERIDGLLPPWDTNLAVAVHRYWRETGYQDGWVQTYLNARAQYRVPFWLSESGENSSPWFYEMVRLFETNRIGWTWWGWKKVDSISCAFSVPRTPAYTYVVSNIWNTNAATNLFYAGLLSLADAVKTTNCQERRGWFESLFNTNGLFGRVPVAYSSNTVPGAMNCADYDIGHANVAYSDTQYWATNYPISAWNSGWTYRNDGVDVVARYDGGGYYVGYHATGEWQRFTVRALHGGRYDLDVTASSTGTTARVEFFIDGTNSLTGLVAIPRTGGWENWQTVTVTNCLVPSTGIHTLKLFIARTPLNLAGFSLRHPDRPFIDFDADGMDDRWEIAHGGDIPAGADPDADRTSNLEEFLADTDPQNGTSVLSCAWSALSATGAVLTLPVTSTGRLYSLQSCTNIQAGGWRNVRTNLAGTGLALNWADTNRFPLALYRWQTEWR